MLGTTKDPLKNYYLWTGCRKGCNIPAVCIAKDQGILLEGKNGTSIVFCEKEHNREYTGVYKNAAEIATWELIAVHIELFQLCVVLKRGQ